ncbi:uncharacterized protein LOC144885472 isoform X2 [Branchiostoma floridae x Branchiostoma japonicum]
MKGSMDLTDIEENDQTKSSEPSSCVEDGSLLVWGSGEFGQTGQGRVGDVGVTEGLVAEFPPKNGAGVKLLACGASHSIVVTVDNEVYAWGNGHSGQLGCGDKETRLTPTRVHLTDNQELPDVAGITCGSRHSFAWLTNGKCYSFGNNYYAQLAYNFRIQNYKENQLRPTLLEMFVHRKVVQVACGDRHTLFLTQEGRVASCGNNANGQLGTGEPSDMVCPKMLDGLEGVSCIACGSYHSLAATGAGDLYVWGSGKPCGTRKGDILAPTRLKTRHANIVMVAGGCSHSLALTANGNVYSWGVGTEGQLGQGEEVLFLSEPTRIRRDLLKCRVVQISCGESYSAALTDLGELYMWGKNSGIIHPDLAATRRIHRPRRVHTGGVCVGRIVCGAWHAAALTGKPDWQRDSKASDLSDLSDSEDLESVAEGGSTSIAWSCDPISSPSQNVTSEAAMDKHLEKERTKISLAEFYAATPEPSPKARKPDEALPTEQLRQSEPMEAFVEETQEDLTLEDNNGRFVYDDDDYEEDEEEDEELHDLYEDDYEEDDDDNESMTAVNHGAKCNSEVTSNDEKDKRIDKMREKVHSTIQESCKTKSSMSTESLPLSKEEGYDSPMQEPSVKERRISTKSPSSTTKPATSAIAQTSIPALDRTVSQTTKLSTDFKDRPVLEDLEMHPEDMSMSIDEGISSETGTTSFSSSPVGSNSKNNVSFTPGIEHSSSNLHMGAKVPVVPSKPRSQSESSQYLPRSRSFMSGPTNRSTKYVSRPQTQDHHADKAHKVMVTNFGFVDLPASSHQRVAHPPPRPKTQARPRQARARDEPSRQSGSRPMVPVPPSKRPSTSSDTQSVASLWSSREMPSSRSAMSSKIQTPSRRRPSHLKNIASSTNPQGQDAANHRLEFKKSNMGPYETQMSSPKRDPVVERKPYVLRSHPFQPASVLERKCSGEVAQSRHRDNREVSLPAGGLAWSKVTGLTRYPTEGPGSSQASDGVGPNPLVSDVMGPSWEQPVFSSGTAWRAKSRAKDPILSGSKTDPKPPQRGKRGEVGPS